MWLPTGGGSTEWYLLAYVQHRSLGGVFFRRVRKTAKSDYKLRHVCPHGTTRVPLDGFLWNLMFDCFGETCREHSGFFKIRQEQVALYMTTNARLWSYLAQLLEWDMFQTKVVEKIKTHISCSIPFLRKWWRLWNNIERCCRAREATDDNMAHAHRMVATQGYKYIQDIVVK
jgi:hypothetical protein